MSHGSVPKTPVHQKQTRFDDLIAQLCQFIAVSERARIKLRQENRINPQLDFKIVSEMSFARGVVLHMGKVPQAEYMRLVNVMQAHPDYEKAVESFCDSVAPPKNRLITTDEFAREQIMAKQMGNVAPADIRGLRRRP